MAKRKKTLFDDVPQYVKDLIDDISKEYSPAKGRDITINNSPYAMNEEKLRAKQELNSRIIAEEEKYKKEPTIKISRAELESWKKSQEKLRKEREELVTVQNDIFIEEENSIPFEEKLELLIPKLKKDGIWDFGIEDAIPFFDITLSYELTGYRPINEIEGLDFDPEWFILSRRNKEATGHYTSAPKGTKAFDDFWLEEYDRLNNGMEVNGYQITGDHYFFLNYYQIMNTENVQYAGQGRLMGFADFYVALYEYFHYVQLCKLLRKNCISLKGRGLGWSEIAASVVANTYHRSAETRSVITAFSDFYLDKTLNKVWTLMNYCNEHTDGGLFNPLGLDQPRKKKTFVEERTTKIEKGWLSEVEGIIADKPSKVRGDRTDVLFYEEFGSFPNSIKAYIQGDALVHVNGIKIGIKLGFGTGGDSGPALAGLSKIFYNPEPYDVLPMRHKYTKTGESALTGFFIPSYRIVIKDETTGRRLMDKRGYTTDKDGIDYYNTRRSKFASDPEGYMIYCAEYCFTPDDALVLEGDNQFNRVLLVDQLAELKLFKRGPKIEKGLIEYDFRGQSHSEENIMGFKWLPSQTAKLQIIERPLRDESGKAYRNLYVAGIDSIDMGKAETSDETRDPSDFCITIFRRAHGTKPPMFVAMYKDRPNDIREAYKTALKLCEWYNCLAVLENSKISLRLYFQERNKANKYLMRRPRATLTDSQGGNSKQFGAPATESVIHHLLDLIAQYIEDYCTEIWFQEMIEELLHYSYENKRKFDIVASMGMALLGDEELQGFVAKPVDEVSSEWRDFGFYIDESGYRRYGVRPQQINIQLGTLESYDYGRPRTSDPRIN